MSKNNLTLERGGEPITLKFDNGTIDHFVEITKVEAPWDYVPADLNFKGVKSLATIILRAALLSNLEAKGQSPIVTEEEVKQWMKELVPEDVYKLIEMWGNLINPAKFRTAGGEAGTDTQPGISQVATG